MLSPAFMNSDYITTVEYKRTLQRQRDGHVTIVPIVVRTLDLGALDDLKGLQALPHDEHLNLRALELWPDRSRNKVLADIAEKIRQTVTDEEPAATSWHEDPLPRRNRYWVWAGLTTGVLLLAIAAYLSIGTTSPVTLAVSTFKHTDADYQIACVL